MGWGINPRAEEKLKLKSEMSDCLKGLNSTGVIDYQTYKEVFDISMKLMDKMYKLGQEDTSDSSRP